MLANAGIHESPVIMASGWSEEVDRNRGEGAGARRSTVLERLSAAYGRRGPGVRLDVSVEQR
jgi:hypothetical protein